MLRVGSSAGDSTVKGATGAKAYDGKNDKYPSFPGEECLSHVAAQYEEVSKRYLVTTGLYEVAFGGEPIESKAIFDDMILQNGPVGSASHDPRIALHNAKAFATNQRNEQRRLDLLLAARTQLYGLVKGSCKTTAPLLCRELEDMCDLSPMGFPGQFDGPRAFHAPLRRTRGEKRSKNDKAYYRAAEQFQLNHPLVKGCTADEYTKRAYSFLVHIRPNLPQSYDDDETADYLVDMMPYKTGGRRQTHPRQAQGVGELPRFHARHKGMQGACAG